MGFGPKKPWGVCELACAVDWLMFVVEMGEAYDLENELLGNCWVPGELNHFAF